MSPATWLIMDDWDTAGAGIKPMNSARAATVLFIRTLGYPKAPAFSSRENLAKPA